MTHRTLAALLLLVSLSACGQSGPLYIPGEPSRIQNPPPAEEPAEDESAEENDVDKR